MRNVVLIHWKETNALCGYCSFLPGQQTISYLVVKYNFEYMRFEYYIKSLLTKKNINHSNLFVLTKDNQSRHDMTCCDLVMALLSLPDAPTPKQPTAQSPILSATFQQQSNRHQCCQT